MDDRIVRPGRRGSEAPKTRPFHVRLTEAQFEAIDRESARLGIDSRAELVRQIVADALGVEE